MNISSMPTFSSSSECSSKLQTPVRCAVELPNDTLRSNYMVIARVMIVLAEISDGIFDIGPSDSYRVDKPSNERLVYGRIAGFFVRIALLKLHCHLRGNWHGLNHAEIRNDRPNGVVLMDVIRVLLPIAIDVHAKLQWCTTKIMYPKAHLHVIIDLPNHALVRNDK